MIEVRSVVIRKSMAAIDKDAHADSISAQFSGYINPSQKEKKIKVFCPFGNVTLSSSLLFFLYIFNRKERQIYTDGGVDSY